MKNIDEQKPVAPTFAQAATHTVPSCTVSSLQPQQQNQHYSDLHIEQMRQQHG